MKIKRLKMLIGVIVVILSGSLLIMTTFAQSNPSTGCTLWDGTVHSAPSGEFRGLTSVAFLQDEVIRATFSATSGSATVSLNSGGAIVAQTDIIAGTPATLSYVIPANGTYTVGARNIASSAPVNFAFDCLAVQQIQANGIQQTVNSGFDDNRINYLDSAAPIVVYPYQDETGLGFDIYSAEGVFQTRITGADVNNLPIADTFGNIISRTSGGGFQITAPQYNGKTYMLQFDAPVTNIGYTSWEQ